MFELLAKQELKTVPLNFAICQDKGIKLSLIQTSFMHPLASGNKLFKLAANIDAVRKSQEYSKILSFGGPYSNHLHALAQVTHADGIECIAVVRGYPVYGSNPTLSVLSELGVKIIWVDKRTYRRRYDVDYLAELQQLYPDALIVPEGGTNAKALLGCQQLGHMINALDSDIDTVVLPCGTGGTLAGLATSLSKQTRLLAYDVVGDNTTPRRVAELIAQPDAAATYQIRQTQTSYGTLNQRLIKFICDFIDQTNILLDPLYTSVVCQKLFDDIHSGAIQHNTHLAILHTGGLQGWYGMKNSFIKQTNEQYWQEYIISNLS